MHAGRATYERHCIGCHASPDARAANPAPDLFRMARTAAPDELIVRLLAGIHGDRMTSLENPFSDEEIASLAAYFGGGERRCAHSLSISHNETQRFIVAMKLPVVQ